MIFDEIVQNFVDDTYKECATQPIVKFNKAILGYDNNHTLYEYYVYFREEVYDIIHLFWNINDKKVENIISLGGYKNGNIIF